MVNWGRPRLRIVVIQRLPASSSVGDPDGDLPLHTSCGKPGVEYDEFWNEAVERFIEVQLWSDDPVRHFQPGNEMSYLRSGA